MDKVIVSLRKGVVIDVQAPPNIDVIIRDYDVDDIDNTSTEIDEDGEAYVYTVW